MPILKKAPNEVRLIVDEMVGMYHTPLRDAKVTIDLLFAFPKSEDDETAPVKLHGYPCVAVVKINAYKLRVLGHGDAEITIDAHQWDELSEEERRALIDHELTHLELRTDKDGFVKRDDLDRPLLKMRKHDHQFGWFDEVARRHGSASVEVQQATDFHRNTYKQLWLLPLFDGEESEEKALTGSAA